MKYQQSNFSLSCQSVPRYCAMFEVTLFNNSNKKSNTDNFDLATKVRRWPTVCLSCVQQCNSVRQLANVALASALQQAHTTHKRASFQQHKNRQLQPHHRTLQPQPILGRLQGETFTRTVAILTPRASTTIHSSRAAALSQAITCGVNCSVSARVGDLN